MKAKIYQDPVTKQDFEGVATLVKKMDDTSREFIGFQRWLVTFGNDPNQYERLVDVDDICEEMDEAK